MLSVSMIAISLLIGADSCLIKPEAQFQFNEKTDLIIGAQFKFKDGIDYQKSEVGFAMTSDDDYVKITAKTPVEGFLKTSELKFEYLREKF